MFLIIKDMILLKLNQNLSHLHLIILSLFFYLAIFKVILIK